MRFQRVKDPFSLRVICTESNGELLNSIRRILLGLKLLHIDDLRVIRNTGVMPNDELASRLGQIPLHSFDKTGWFVPCNASHTCDKSLNGGCSHCQLSLHLSVECPVVPFEVGSSVKMLSRNRVRRMSDNQDFEGKIHIIQLNRDSDSVVSSYDSIIFVVTRCDRVVVMENVYSCACFLTPRNLRTVTTRDLTRRTKSLGRLGLPVHVDPPIPIAILRGGESLKFEAIVRRGSPFPDCVAYLRIYPRIPVIFGDEKDQLSTERVELLESTGKRSGDLSTIRVEKDGEFYRAKGDVPVSSLFFELPDGRRFNNSVRRQHVLCIESFGGLYPMEMLLHALEIMQKKIQTVLGGM